MQQEEHQWHHWTLEATWKLMNRQAYLHQLGTLTKQDQVCTGQQIWQALKQDRMAQAQTTREEINVLLEAGKLQQAWIKLKAWCKHSGKRYLNQTRRVLKRPQLNLRHSTRQVWPQDNQCSSKSNNLMSMITHQLKRKLKQQWDKWNQGKLAVKLVWKQTTLNTS